MKLKIVVLLLLLTGVAIALVFAFPSLLKRDTAFTASGTLEARNIEVGSRVGGRVTKLYAAEGDPVRKDQLLVAFDDAELSAALLQARGRYAQAQANLTKMIRGSRPEEIAEARAVGASRQHAIERAEAAVARAYADRANAEQEFQRADRLFKEGVISREQRDAAERRLRVSQADSSAAEHAVTIANSEAQAAAAAQKLTESGFRPEDIAAARAEVERAEGELKQSEARYLEREVRSPADAVVEVLDLRPGDIVPPNAPVARLLEADQLFVVVFVPQSRIGKVYVGQAADIEVDAFPKEPFRGIVEQIRQQAEFLPRNVQTKEEREHQVVGVKIRVENPERRLRAGINADVRFHGVE
jgi:multidrug resistance efflux pump